MVRWVADGNSATDVCAGHGPQPLLLDMDELVSEPVLPLAVVGHKGISTEDDLIAYGVGSCRHRRCRLGGLGIRVNPDMGEVSSQSTFHLGPKLRRKRLSAAFTHHF